MYQYYNYKSKLLKLSERQTIKNVTNKKKNIVPYDMWSACDVYKHYCSISLLYWHFKKEFRLFIKSQIFKIDRSNGLNGMIV